MKENMKEKIIKAVFSNIVKNKYRYILFFNVYVSCIFYLVYSSEYIVKLLFYKMNFSIFFETMLSLGISTSIVILFTIFLDMLYNLFISALFIIKSMIRDILNVLIKILRLNKEKVYDIVFSLVKIIEIFKTPSKVLLFIFLFVVSQYYSQLSTVNLIAYLSNIDIDKFLTIM